MKAIEPMAGSHIYEVLTNAWDTAHEAKEEVSFSFNGTDFTVGPSETFASVKRRWEEVYGSPLTTPAEDSRAAKVRLDALISDQAKAIADSGVPTEEQMRSAADPNPRSPQELEAYIRSLVDRPHDYGTCVYAMSLAAVAAANYVGRALGVKGYQASAADMDFIRRQRSLKHGFRIIDYGNLLYPQYCTDENTPGWRSAINDPDIRGGIAKAAGELLSDDSRGAHPEVVAHWGRIVAGDTF